MRLRMVISAAILSSVLIFQGQALGQVSPPTQVAKKFQGENVTFTWTYDLADEATITHFSLKWVDTLTGTFIQLKTVPKNLRTTSINANFTPGFKFTYFAMTAVDTTAAPAGFESVPSNTVGVERVGRPPRDLAIP